MSTYNIEKGVTEMSLVQEEKIKLEPVVKNEKLSTIIRSFQGNFKQGRYCLLSKDDKYCVLGALGFSGGVSKDDLRGGNYAQIRRLYPELDNNHIRHDGDLLTYMFKLNDTRRLDFNQIADELEGIGY